MERIYVKGMGMIPNTAENKELLIKLELIKNDTITEKPKQPIRSNTKRVKQPKLTK